MISSLVALLIVIVIVAIIFGALVYLVDASPIPSPYKAWVRWLIIVIGVLIVILKALPMLGVSV